MYITAIPLTFAPGRTAPAPSQSTGPWADMPYDERRAVLLELIEGEGLSASQAAERIGGASRSAIIGFCYRAKIKMRPPCNPAVARAGTASRVKSPRRITLPALFTGPLPETAPRILRKDIWKPLPGTTPISLLEIDTGRCRWPVEGGFCGCQTVGHQYCPAHRRAAKRKPRKGAK